MLYALSNMIIRESSFNNTRTRGQITFELSALRALHVSYFYFKVKVSSLNTHVIHGAETLQISLRKLK